MIISRRFVVLSAICVISFGSGNSSVPTFKLKPLPFNNIQDPSDVKQTNIPSTRVLQSKPANTAVYAGDNVTFYCSTQPRSNARIQWWEWISSSTPQLISDQDLLTRHPNMIKYQIEQPNSYTYNLIIRDVQLTDVGTYTCLDSAFGPPCTNVSAEQAGNIASADLIVLTSEPECDTTISPSGSVLEDAYHTAECVMYFRGKVQPTITWTGPSPYSVFRQSTPTYAWSGIELNVTRFMENLAFTAVSKFESNDSSSNFNDSAPVWNYTYQTPALNVSWGPKNLYAIPVKEFYHVGDVLRCYADAKPAASYVWQNMQNGDRFNTQTFTVSANMLDNTWTLRCQAINSILGTVYSANIAVTVTVVTNPDTSAAEPHPSTDQTTQQLPTTGLQENNSSSGYPCETWFYDHEGEVVSYNYPWGNPLQYSYCYYYIYVYQSTPLTFTFNSPFEIGHNGYYGYVEIYSINTGEWYSYSGSTPPSPVYFSYNYHGYIRILYYSQSPVPEVGFSLNYTRESGAVTVTDAPHDSTTGSSSGTRTSEQADHFTTDTMNTGSAIPGACGQTFFTDQQGTISSPNYPNQYQPNTDCTYYIQLYQYSTIELVFQSPFYLEPCCDWVKVYVDQYGCGGISSEQVYTYFGSEVPSTLVLYSCYKVMIQFHSDGSGEGYGFSIRYNAGGYVSTATAQDSTTDYSSLILQNNYAGSSSLFFKRPWTEYQQGFGSPEALYWIGLDRLHEMSQGNCKVRFNLQDRYNGGTWYHALYTSFSVSDSSTNYTLTIGGYSGDAGYDAMAYHNGQQFSTYDADHDGRSGNCANQYGGGFWYDDCAQVYITATDHFLWYTSSSAIVLNAVKVFFVC